VAYLELKQSAATEAATGADLELSRGSRRKRNATYSSRRTLVPPSVLPLSLSASTTTTSTSVWYQLSNFGSRVVDAVCVSEDKSGNNHVKSEGRGVEGTVGAEEPEEEFVGARCKVAEEPEEEFVGASCEVSEDRSEGRGVEGTVGAEEPEEGCVRATGIAEEPEEDRAYGGHESEGRGVEGTVGAVVRMEGSNVKTLIAKRMGIPQGKVESKLVSLQQRGKLDGTADRSPADRLSGAVRSPGLTGKDLEEFELAEAEARNMAPLQTGTPYKLAFKPAVHLGNTSASSQAAASTSTAAATTPWSAAAATSPRPAPATPAPEAEGKDEDDEVEMVVNTQPHSVATTSNWSEEMDEEEAPPPPPPVPESSEIPASDVWPERKRYEEAVEAKHIYGTVSSIEVPLLDRNGLAVNQLQTAVQEVVSQVNVAHQALATAGYVVAERSRWSLQQAKIAGDMATEALLKAYEVAAVAASSSRQSWKMCVTFTGPDMPVRSKEAEGDWCSS
jgi:hypothetical protein